VRRKPKTRKPTRGPTRNFMLKLLQPLPYRQIAHELHEYMQFRAGREGGAYALTIDAYEPELKRVSTISGASGSITSD
jgi:hypothetical protein